MATPITRKYPRCIATISAGFEKGDFLVREEKGQRVYFDFFEEAFNYIAAKGYSRMPKGEEGEWMDLMVSDNLLRYLYAYHSSTRVDAGGCLWWCTETGAGVWYVLLSGYEYIWTWQLQQK